MSNKKKIQFNPDQDEAKRQIDSLVQGGMNYVAATIVKKIDDVLAELEASDEIPVDINGFKRGLAVARVLAEVHIKPNSL